MRLAILIQGEPRFCAEFDQFISSIQGYDQVDWYFYLWKTSPPTSKTVGHDGHKLVAPWWQNISNPDLAKEKTKMLLPAGHRIVRFEAVDQNEVPVKEITENYATETNQSNVWKMWYSLHKVNSMKIEQEQAENFKYDAVIRTRPDVALYGDISASNIKSKLDTNNNQILIPTNKKCGYDGVWICDLVGIGTSDAMNAYTDLYNQALDHHARGVKFHPETMLGRHLEHNGLSYPSGDFTIEFRNLGTWHSTATGETWPGNAAPDWNEDKIYISNFGNWN
jgi:hypothetical protein